MKKKLGLAAKVAESDGGEGDFDSIRSILPVTSFMYSG